VRRPGPMLLATLAMAGLLAACADGGSGQAEPAPTVTVTVTEEAPSPSDDTSPGTVLDVCNQDGLDGFAFIFVTSPTPGAPLSDGATVEGCSNTFEAGYVYELLDRDGAVLDEGFGAATCGSGCVGTFSFPVSFTVAEAQVGTLRVFAESAEDGSEVDVNAIPVMLEP
jgi:hypothetical protein